MQLTILGCSGAKSVGKSPTCILIDNKVLIDCGSVVSKLESNFIIENINCLLLTHSHFDHILELPFLLELLLEKSKKPFNVYASGDSINSLYSNVFNYELWPDLFDIAKKQGLKLKLEQYNNLVQLNIDGYQVTPVNVNHTITTHGFIIDDGDCSVAFTGDTYATDLFWDQCNSKENLKAVIVDVSFPSTMPEAAEVTRHMSTEIAAAELDKLNDKNIEVLISHMKPKLTEHIILEIEAMKLGFNTTILEDGMNLEF